MPRGRSLVALVALLALGAAPARADESKAGVVTAVQGQSTVARPVLPQPVPLKFRDDVFVRDRIDTRENSVVRLLLGGKAVVTVRELASFTVTEEPGRAVVDLQAGTLALGVAKKLLKPGESIEIRTPNAIAAVRGSFIVVRVALLGGVPHTSVVSVHVSVPVTVAFRATPTVSLALGSSQVVTVSGLGAATTSTAVQTLTPAQAAEAARAAEVSRPTEHTDQPASEAASRAVEATQSEAAGIGDGILGTAGPGSTLPTPRRTLGRSPTATPPPPPAAGAPPPSTTLITTPPPPASPPPTTTQTAPPPPPPPTQTGPAPAPPPPPSSSAFKPPGQGGSQPNTGGNPTPGHGGVPPGQQKK